MTMKTAVVLFSCLAVAYSQTVFCKNGVIPCAANANCTTPAGDCVCNAGFSGDGRVYCASSTTRCVCTARADPQLTLFDPNTTPDTMTENLPCSIIWLQGATIMSNPLTSGTCVVSVVANPEIRTGANSSTTPFRTFVGGLRLLGNAPGVTFDSTLDGSGFSPSSSAVNVTSAGGYNIATLTSPSCLGFNMRFNATYGGAAIDATRSPAMSAPGNGLCGTCNGVSDNPGTTNATRLAYLLANLAPSTFQVGPYASQCGTIQTTVGFCPAANVPAIGVCWPYLSTFGVCAKNAGQTGAQIMTAMQSCVAAACAAGGAGGGSGTGAPTAACNQIAGYGMPIGCPAPTPCP